MYFSSRKRVALISVHGDPAVEIGKEEAGGQNVYVRHVGEALAQQGWLVDMFTRRVSAEQPEIVQHSEHCRTIRLTAGPQKFIPRDDLFEFLPEFVQAFLDFQSQLEAPYQLVHTNYWLSSWVGMQLKKRQPLRQVHTYHSLGAVKYKSIPTIPLIARTRLAVEKMVLETADRIVATSPQEKEHMRSLVSSLGSIDIIPCGTDVEHFSSADRQAARQSLGIAPDEKVALYVGRFDPRKGIETLVRAIGQSSLRQTGRLKLIIGGGSVPGQSDGLERERIEEIVAELGMTEMVTFPGRLSREILPTYFTAADVSVVPSHYEPFGLVTIEAMAAGTPVVGSDVGGLKYTVASGETGLLVPPKDVDAFASAIDQILSDAEVRDRMGQAAKDRVQALFSWDGVATQLDALYNRLLEKQPQPIAEKSSELTPVSA